MTDRPALFSTPMVRALLDGRKTQTRRLLKPQPTGPFLGVVNRPGGDKWWFAAGAAQTSLEIPVRFAVGDRLWVRETWCDPHDDRQCVYWADLSPGEQHDHDAAKRSVNVRKSTAYRPWRSPIYMPRRASRITLTVTTVRIERLQAITQGGAAAEGLAEGVFGDRHTSPRLAFRLLWESLHGDGAWEANPAVVVIAFTVEKRNIDAIAAAA